ncbi:site-specific recombinase XerC [Mycobacterium sp. URHB0021]
MHTGGSSAHAEGSCPEWFAAFLADRGTRKPSAHTLKAYRQDFDAIARFVIGSDAEMSAMALGDITTDAMRGAFARFAETHEAASIQRCWSTWNVLCTFLYTSEMIVANPMPLVGRPKIAKTLPKGLPSTSVQALLAAIDSDSGRRASDWVERDRALILTSLLAGLRADELLRSNVGDVRRSEDGAVIHVRGKGGKDRRIPVGKPRNTLRHSIMSAPITCASYRSARVAYPCRRRCSDSLLLRQSLPVRRRQLASQWNSKAPISLAGRDARCPCSFQPPLEHVELPGNDASDESARSGQEGCGKACRSGHSTVAPLPRRGTAAGVNVTGRGWQSAD